MAQKRVAIIGGGPAGLRAAEIAAQAGHRVTVYDGKPSVGRKLLLAGAHGGLNLTHSDPLDLFITRFGAAQAAMKPCLESFTPADLTLWAQELGQKTFVGTSKRVFLKEMQAKGLLRAWLARLAAQGVAFAPSHRWIGWDAAGELLFLGPDAQEITARADATLLALGGASWPRTGSDGSWYEILEAQNIPLSPLEPANCGFIVPWSPYIAHRFAGKPLKPVTVTFGGDTRQGELTVTEKGLEGSLIYALSPALRSAIISEGRAVIELDLRCGLSVEDLTERLKMPRKALSFSNYLRKASGLSPLSIALIREVVPPESLPVNDCAALAALIKKLPVTLTATAGLDRAISTAGGVRFDALDAAFMLKHKAGVFIAGEMLDWEAPTGGYLLQGVLSSATHAARGLCAYLNQA
ncbi:MAG: TIGR03862 family flavoprotein [Alphaproteobacteria bacterium]|nr:TIGR03862 family flavoprotein [Alphaproteobacteria bacterium]